MLKDDSLNDLFQLSSNVIEIDGSFFSRNTIIFTHSLLSIGH